MSFTDFFCIGFQKCGTSTLYELLAHHPDIVLTRDVKEPMFYRVRGLRKICGPDFYKERYFGHVADDDPRLKGEINAGLGFSGCAKKLGQDFGPDAKLIFMLRNPVDRCYSAYKYFLARGWLPSYAVRNDVKYGHAKGFDLYVNDVLGSRQQSRQIMKKRMKYIVFSQSNYAQCIREYLEWFPKENMKFILFEDFTEDQHKTCRALYDFLGIPDSDQVPYGIHANENHERTTAPASAKVLYILKGLNYILFEFMFWRRDSAREARRKSQDVYQKIRSVCMLPDEDHEPMLPQTRSMLVQYYSREVEELSRITGIDLCTRWACSPQPAEKVRGKKRLPRTAIAASAGKKVKGAV